MNDKEHLLNKAGILIEQGQPEEALKLLNLSVISNSEEALFLKGEICYKLQRWGDSLNYFSKFLDLYPTNDKALSYCALIQNILGFYHKDLYNP
jgi:tetratricopeptide (TPR) repeat protein